MIATWHHFIAEKLETIFILPFFSPTHEITYIAGYLLTTDDEYSAHYDQYLGSVTGCVEKTVKRGDLVFSEL